MGYESKIYITRKNEYSDWNEVVATFDLCKMGHDLIDGKPFRHLFTEPVGCMYADDGDTELRKDCYGDDIEGAPIESVIEWLGKWLETNHYARAEVFYTLLMEMDAKIDGELWCYHYGY